MNYFFNSRPQTLTVVLKPAVRTFIGTQMVKQPGLKAIFTNHVWETDDAEAAELLRSFIEKGKEREVVELTNLDELVYKPKKSQNIRRALTADETGKTMGGTNLKEKAAAAENLKCIICDKEFKNQKALNMHLVSHRPGVQVAEPEAERKAS